MTESAGSDLTLRDVSLHLPEGRSLVKDQSLVFARGEWVAIGGRSGAGKSTVFRALAGLWPFGSGQVEAPAGRRLFLPQRPYIPLGTLRRAVTYPDAVETHDDAVIRATLHDVGLGHLEPLLDAEEPWGQRLSGGEQQRLAIARALLVRPDWLFLDEATASLDTHSEAELYALLRARLPDATIISIAHRPTVTDLHARRLVLGDGGLVAG